MVFNKKRPISGAVVDKTDNFSARLKHRVQSITPRQRIIWGLTTVILLTAISIGIVYWIRYKTPTPTESQVIDQKVNELLQKLEEDPSSVPSGQFMPEKGDDFRVKGTDTTNSEAEQ